MKRSVMRTIVLTSIGFSVSLLYAIWRVPPWSEAYQGPFANWAAEDVQQYLTIGTGIGFALGLSNQSERPRLFGPLSQGLLWGFVGQCFTFIRYTSDPWQKVAGPFWPMALGLVIGLIADVYLYVERQRRAPISPAN